jgi:flavin-dependent dehydrogenase
VSETVTTDAVVVGARCSGSSTATALARAGRRVIAIDGATFPSDTLSTHLLFAGGVAELKRVGALERVEKLGAPRMPKAIVAGSGITVRSKYSPVDGIDYGLCVRRTGLDMALVETAREAGAEVREGVRAKELIWNGSRVAGVVAKDRDGNELRLEAPLVVGADGRRSFVAREVGAMDPYRSNPNGRACYFAYWDDVADEDWRATAAQWRAGEELGTAFPCDGGRLLVLLMPPRDRAHEFQDEATAEYDRTIEVLLPELAERLRGCTRATKVRFATDLPSYFRRSSGPGWALPGDSGHFKDPVTAQGIRDAVRFGRLLGETVAPALDSAAALDKATRVWEKRRERECHETYHWTNRLARAEAMTPLEIEAYRYMADNPDVAGRLLDVFSRQMTPSEAFPTRLGVRLLGRALRRAGADRAEVVRVGARELKMDAREWFERTKSARNTGGVPELAQR